MEGDAGASRHRLNPLSMSRIRRLRNRRSEIHEESEASPEESHDAADSRESEGGTEQVTAESGPDAPAPEEASGEPDADGSDTDVERRPSRLGRGWLVGISVALVLMAGAVGAGGYLALRANHESQVLARNDAAALQAARDCIAATQAPDASAMSASEQKIIECGSDQYRSQALLYSGTLVQVYQAANVHVQVSDMRAAVERNNSDGTIDVLVALRLKVANDQAQPQEVGYRMRVKMAFVEGQYRISKLDQVTK